MLSSVGCSPTEPTAALDGSVAPDGRTHDAGMVTDDGGPSSLDATSSDADSMTPMPDPERPDNAMRDSDCDGLSDAEEYGTVWPSGMRTDPANPDSDGDGLPDGLEVGRTASVDPSCTPAVFHGTLSRV